MDVRRPGLDAETLSIWLAGLSIPVTLASGLGMAPLMAAWAVSILILDRFQNIPPSVLSLSIPTLTILAAIMGWTAVSMLWSPIDPSFSILSWFKFAGGFLCGWVILRRLAAFDDPAKGGIAQALWWGELTSLIVIGIFSFGWRITTITGSDLGNLFGMLTLHADRAATVASLLLWPTVLGLWRQGQKRRVAVLFALAVICLTPCMSLSAKAALVTGGIVFLASRGLPRWSARAAILLCLAALMAAPLAGRALPEPDAVIGWHLPSSLAHRLAIWKFVAGKVPEQPLFGHGWQSSRVLGDGQFFTLNSLSDVPSQQPLLPLHPHDGPLQIWLELGGVGAILAALLCWRLLLVASRTGSVRPGDWSTAAAVFASAFLVASVSYGLWQEWWQGTLWLLVALMATQMARPGAD